MKKIHLMSDLHLERHYANNVKKWINTLISTDVDYLILAGDICSSVQFNDIISEFCNKYNNVIFVTGNHEYYGANPADVHFVLEKLKRKINNFHWLHNESKIIDGTKFVGGTLWFPKYENEIYKNRIYLNDFFAIKNFEPWVYEEHLGMLNVLNKEAKDSDVIVTHHLPADKCIDNQYRFGNMSLLNPYFCVDLTINILKWQPKLMCFGHTHTQYDNKIKNTRLVCNPLGYISHTINSAFYEPKTIYIDK